jgi:hypothetical protein
MQYLSRNRLINLRWISLVALFFCSSAIAQELLLFGGHKHDQYLGCLRCSEFRSDSVCNGFGKYGNEFGSNMWNEFSSPFGNEFSSSSPWNEFSSSNSVPVLVDRNGKFYGYFTINDTRSNAVRFSSELKKIYERYSGNLEKVRTTLCEMIN